MGGNALKKCETVRLSAKDYFVIKDELDKTFHALGYKAIAIPAYSTKESFGDIDILVSDDIGTNRFESVLLNLKPKEMVKNGNVYSLEYKNFQVDLILTPHEDMTASYIYFSYNDLGNLMGRIAHKQGIKFGHRGTSYVFRDDLGNVVEEFKITNLFHVFCSAFNFSIERYNKGFNTLEDIFEFVAASKYFNPDIYLLDNLNHKSRVRDSKRKTYNTFLKWCETKKETDWVGREFFQYTESKRSYLPRLFDAFAGYSFAQRWFETYGKELENREFKRKFNGHIVRNIVSLDGEKLGHFIAFFKNLIEQEMGWVVFMAISSPEEIENKILKAFSRYFTEGYV